MRCGGAGLNPHGGTQGSYGDAESRTGYDPAFVGYRAAQSTGAGFGPKLNTAIDSTCDVCGNMFATPAFLSA